MSLYSRTVDYINSNDFGFRLSDIEKFVYNNSTRTTSVRQYVNNLSRCGFLTERGQFDVIYKRKKLIPSYITTSLIDMWSKTMEDEQRKKAVAEYCKVQDRKLKIEHLLSLDNE